MGCFSLFDGSLVDFDGKCVQSEVKRCAFFSDWILPSVVWIMLLCTLYCLVRGTLGNEGYLDVWDGVSGGFSRLVLVQFEEYCFLVRLKRVRRCYRLRSGTVWLYGRLLDF